MSSKVLSNIRQKGFILKKFNHLLLRILLLKMYNTLKMKLFMAFIIMQPTKWRALVLILKYFGIFPKYQPPLLIQDLFISASYTIILLF